MALRIGEVAQRAGIATSAIRYYEREGLIPKADRFGNARVYGTDILDRLALIAVVEGKPTSVRLALIALAKSAGFTIAETRRLLRGVSRRTPPGPRWRAQAQKKLVEVEARLAEAERMRSVLRKMMGCECPTFEDCTRAAC